MKLTTGEMHDLVTALNQLEQVDLTSEAYIKVAININILKPYAMGYEIATRKMLAAIQGPRRADGTFEKSAAQIDTEFAEQNASLRDEEHNIELRTLSKADLRMSDNGKKLHGALLAKLWPILVNMEG